MSKQHVAEKISICSVDIYRFSADVRKKTGLIELLGRIELNGIVDEDIQRFEKRG